MTRDRSTAERGRVRIEGFDEAVAAARANADADTDVDGDTGADVDDTDTDGDPTADSERCAGRESGSPAVPKTAPRGRLEDAWRRFRSDRTAVLGLAIVAVLVFAAVFARPIEFSTSGYTITLQPFSLAPYDPDEMYVGPANAGPSPAHPFGTDWAGRDQFSRVLVGGRFSLSIGVVAVALALLVGVPLGAIAGYFGGRVDEAIMRLVDVLYAFPFLVLAIAIVAIVGQGYWNVVTALALTGWVGYARLLRGEILSVKEREYVTAARALGVPDRLVIARHVVPNAVGPVVVQATLNVGTVVLTAAALGFLGLGLDPSTAEWGAMLADARDTLAAGHWHLTVFPGLAIFLFVTAINLVGDGIDDALDPRGETAERKRRRR